MQFVQRRKDKCLLFHVLEYRAGSLVTPERQEVANVTLRPVMS